MTAPERPIVGRIVQVNLLSEFHSGRVGRYTGLVRKATGAYLTIQRPSNPDATTASAQYRGDRIKVLREEVLGVFHYGKLRPLPALPEPRGRSRK